MPEEPAAIQPAESPLAELAEPTRYFPDTLKITRGDGQKTVYVLRDRLNANRIVLQDDNEARVISQGQMLELSHRQALNRGSRPKDVNA